MTLEEVLEGAKNAYSIGSYTPTAWSGIAKQLLSLGLSGEEAIAFLCSKHMRWCLGHSPKPEGTLRTLRDFKNYLTSSNNFPHGLRFEVDFLMAGG